MSRESFSFKILYFSSCSHIKLNIVLLPGAKFMQWKMLSHVDSLKFFFSSSQPHACVWQRNVFETKTRDRFTFSCSLPRFEEQLEQASCVLQNSQDWYTQLLQLQEKGNYPVLTHRACVSDEWQVEDASVIKNSRQNLFWETHADAHRQWCVRVRNEQESSLFFIWRLHFKFPRRVYFGFPGFWKLYLVFS